MGAMHRGLPLVLVLLSLSCNSGWCFVSGNGIIMEDSREIGQKPTMNFQEPPDLSSPPPRGLYLNVDYPAVRDGNLFSWSFCYHITGEEHSKPNITVGVWRPADNNSLQVLPESLQSIPVDITNAQFEFICQKFNANSNISIQVGDIVGAYIPTTQTNVHIAVESSDATIVYTNSSNIDSVDCNLLSRTSYGLFVTGSMDVSSVVVLPSLPTAVVATPTAVITSRTSSSSTSTVVAASISVTTARPSLAASVPFDSASVTTTTSTSATTDDRTTATVVFTEPTTSSPMNAEANHLPVWIYFVIGVESVLILMIGVLMPLTLLLSRRCYKRHHQRKSTLDFSNHKSISIDHDDLQLEGDTNRTTKHHGNGETIKHHGNGELTHVEVSCTVIPNDSTDGASSTHTSAASLHQAQQQTLPQTYPPPTRGWSHHEKEEASSASKQLRPAHVNATTQRPGKMKLNAAQSPDTTLRKTTADGRPLPAVLQRFSYLQRTNSTPELHSSSLPNPVIETSQSNESLYAKPTRISRTDKVDAEPYLEFSPTYSYAYGMVGSRLENYRGNNKRYENTQSPRPKHLGQIRGRSVTSPLATPDYAVISDNREKVLGFYTSSSSSTNSAKLPLTDELSESNNGCAKPPLMNELSESNGCAKLALTGESNGRNGVGTPPTRKKPELKPKPVLCKEQLASRHSSAASRRRNFPAIREEVIRHTGASAKGAPEFGISPRASESDSSSVSSAHFAS